MEALLCLMEEPGLCPQGPRATEGLGPRSDVGFVYLER